MYHSLPSRYSPNDWILYGILVVGGILLIVASTAILRSLLPRDTVYVAGTEGIPVKFVGAVNHNGTVTITVDGPTGRRDVSVSENNPLAQHALDLQPGTQLRLPKTILP